MHFFLSFSYIYRKTKANQNLKQRQTWVTKIHGQWKILKYLAFIVVLNVISSQKADIILKDTLWKVITKSESENAFNKDPLELETGSD